MILTKKTILIASAFVLLTLTLPGCRRTPDETQVREAISAMVEAAEAGSARNVGKPLSEDFDGNAGSLDRRGLTGLVRLLALRGDHVGVTMGPVSIERRGERVVATFTVTLSSGGKLLPDQMGIYRVESAWRNEDGHWRCYSATWKRVV